MIACKREYCKCGIFDSPNSAVKKKKSIYQNVVRYNFNISFISTLPNGSLKSTGSEGKVRSTAAAGPSVGLSGGLPLRRKSNKIFTFDHVRNELDITLKKKS